MHKIERQALLPFSAKSMYKLVNDIASYPEFVPACEKAEVLETFDNKVKASLTLKKVGIECNFTTINTLEINKRVSMQLIDGPFNYLNGTFEFIDISDAGSKVILNLDFEISSTSINSILSPVVDKVADKVMASFVSRANKVYGN